MRHWADGKRECVTLPEHVWGPLILSCGPARKKNSESNTSARVLLQRVCRDQVKEEGGKSGKMKEPAVCSPSNYPLGV